MNISNNITTRNSSHEDSNNGAFVSLVSTPWLRVSRCFTESEPEEECDVLLLVPSPCLASSKGSGLQNFGCWAESLWLEDQAFNGFQ